MAATDSSTALQPAPAKTHSQEATENRQETDSATSTAKTDIRWKRDSYSRPRQDSEHEPSHNSVDSDKFRRKEVRTIGEILEEELFPLEAPVGSQYSYQQIRDSLCEAAVDDRDGIHLRRWRTGVSYPPTTSSGQSTRQHDMWSSFPSSIRRDSHGGSLDIIEADGLDEVLEDHSFAEYPAVDTLHDESVASWPMISCSELGSERIRLLKIIPGPMGSTIECEVNTCFLDQAPSYTAVSYTWGSPSDFREIRIEGRAHGVAKNLWRFLDQARKLPGSTRLNGWLWIDALSIDQSDPLEKLDQVGIISSIFGKAERTVVWLGPIYDHSDRALSALRPKRTGRPRRDSRVLANPLWSAVHSLCERPYWRRLWVYQELKSAAFAELMCGDKLVSIRDFQERFLGTATYRSEDKVEILRNSSAGRMLGLIEDPATDSLFSLIQKTGHLRCADPRDKAYAILNVARKWNQGMKADYTITVPVLLNRILENMHDITLPESLEEVAEQCTELERLFGEPPNSIFQTEGPVTFDCNINPLKELASHSSSPEFRLKQILHAWCGFHSHKRIPRLVWPLSRARSDNPRVSSYMYPPKPAKKYHVR
jgi:hypothetical protein